MDDKVAKAIAGYIAALRDYESEFLGGGCPSYSTIDLMKCLVGEAYLATLGFPLQPNIEPKHVEKVDMGYRKIPIPEELRWQVFRRDDFTCKKCGRQDHLRADHVIPESKGGKAILENLQTLCQWCNSSKGAGV